MMETLIIHAVKTGDTEFLRRNDLELLPDKIDIHTERYDPESFRLRAYNHQPLFNYRPTESMKKHIYADSMGYMVVDAMSVCLGNKSLFLIGDDVIFLEKY